jgi:glycosyltransferase involved in cell wall biosynthesis
MGDRPLVSIVLPVWNGQRFLASAIESVLRQTFGDLELIVVNDCSTDRSLEIAKQYAANDARVRILDNAENLKLPASLNRGFEVARGDYFTWTSDDNLLHSTFVETLRSELEAGGGDLIYSDFNSIDETGRFLGISEAGAADGLVAYNTIGASFLYRRAVHETLNGYDPMCFLYEDYDFWIRAYLAGFRFIRSKSIVYDYRRHSQSLTSTRKVPDAYAFYRYNLRKRFHGIDRRTAFRAREILMGYRSILGLHRWSLLLLEAGLYDPLATIRFLSAMALRIPKKVSARCASGFRS